MGSRVLLLLVCVASASTVACDGLSDDDTGDDDSTGDDDTDLPVTWDFSAEVPEGAFLVDSDTAIPCVWSLDPLCGEDYWDFPFAASNWRNPITQEQLVELMTTIGEVGVLPPGEDPADISRAIVGSWGVAPLLEQVEAVALRQASVTEEEDRGYTRQQVIIHDPWVGSFRVLIHFPNTEPPWPALLAMHGHGTESVDWPDTYHGLDYVAAGYALASIDHRMMYADEAESEVGCFLLENGFSLLGLHAYETFVAQRYLRWLGTIDPDRIGLIGHSAGANKVNQFLWMTDAFAVGVTDLLTDIITFEDGNYSCHEAWIPSMRPWQDNINDLASAPRPSLFQSYGFPDGSTPVLEFLAENL